MQENKIIEDIVNNAAQKLKEKYIITHYPELYDKIINFTINTNSILEFKQKFWHYINNEKNIPGCKTCGAEIKQYRSITKIQD